MGEKVGVERDGEREGGGERGKREEKMMEEGGKEDRFYSYWRVDFGRILCWFNYCSFLNNFFSRNFVIMGSNNYWFVCIEYFLLEIFKCFVDIN